VNAEKICWDSLGAVWFENESGDAEKYEVDEQAAFGFPELRPALEIDEVALAMHLLVSSLCKSEVALHVKEDWQRRCINISPKCLFRRRPTADIQ
jgi:hypothetical protein